VLQGLVFAAFLRQCVHAAGAFTGPSLHFKNPFSWWERVQLAFASKPGELIKMRTI
jgi:hypothetical protein